MDSLTTRFNKEVFSPYLDLLKAGYRVHPRFAHAEQSWSEKLTMKELVNGPYLEKSQAYAPGEPLETLGLHERTKATIQRRLKDGKLYKHQTDALELILNGENAVIATGTSSGKTLCYQIPILDQLIRDPSPGLRAIIRSRQIKSPTVRRTRRRSSMPPTRDWPHAPVHRLGSNGVYMVTGATLHKEHLFSTDEKLSLLENHLLALARNYQWQLEAWAIFVNHYHFVARGHPDARPLDEFLKHLHSETARNLNRLDQSTGREVWFNFWDTKLTYERSYLARLNYVHQNAVKHGLVMVANQYPWCSAAWFEHTASLSAVKTIYSFKTDKLKINDDY